VLLVVIAAVTVLRNLTAPTTGQAPSAAQATARSASAMVPVALSKAVEWGSIAAVVVLPFAPVPADSARAARLAEAVSDDLINNLSRVPGFRVISRGAGRSNTRSASLMSARSRQTLACTT
jgi:TolB-like protein